jgi:hypothetical protein
VRTGAGAVLVAAGLAGLGAVACGPGGPGPNPGTTTTTAVPEVPATTLPGTPSRPSPLVAVGDDGALVVLDAGTGARVRKLAEAPDGRAIRGVTLAPDGATAWFDAGSGSDRRVYAVPTDGSAAPTVVASGWSPEVSPDGASLAYATDDLVIVRTLATGAEAAYEAISPASALAWAADGDHLVWVAGSSQLVDLDLSAPSPFPASVPGAVAGPGEQLYAPLASSGQLATVIVGSGPDDTTTERLVVGTDLTVTRGPDGLTGGARDRASDASGLWGVRADGHRNLRWSVGGGTGLIASGYTAADW